MTDLCAAAVDYARGGWPVLPLHGKVPRTAHGLKDASIDPDVIGSWWRAWPNANVGLLTGVAFDVLDVDDIDALDLLDARRPPDGSLPVDGPAVVTGKGTHFYVAPTGCGNRTALVDGADWRGRGGYVVAPPSLHSTGRMYRWATPPDTPLSAVEPWLLQLIAPPPQLAVWLSVGRSAAGQVSIAGLVGLVRDAPIGTRNDRLNYAAHRVGLDVRAGRIRDVAGACQELHAAARAVGLGDQEIERTIRSGLRGAGLG